MRDRNRYQPPEGVEAALMVAGWGKLSEHYLKMLLILLRPDVDFTRISTCARCGDFFWMRRNTGVYCSDKCRMYARRDKQRQVA